MADWTMTTIRIGGTDEQLELVRSAIDETRRVFDFNAILPMPSDLDDSTNPFTVVETEAARDEELERQRAADAELEELALDPEPHAEVVTRQEFDRRVAAFGAADWFEWRTLTWGTKWEGMRTQVLRDRAGAIVLRFETAWDAPRGVLEELVGRGVSVVGGFVHEDGSRFEQFGDADEFERTFVLVETEEDIDGEPRTMPRIELRDADAPGSVSA